ncbi:TonB-dependent receptor [Sphingomonas melonis]|uniref:Outer membrane receptor protein involved in Fe transport n=1 Tax=Sphingomonas melonis TaxID=152682 RepID=A0A7Y9FMS8_9SPHN|nr:TonB-dependent receptor [Sphingomonas melonis]NYD90190.1 outer membrane receptor protein involved in Fe transport [Sphingomonas melonis]
MSFDIAKRYTLRASVNNLFDRDPPLVPDSRSTLGLLRANTMFNYDLLGRQIVMGVTTTF